MQAFRDLSRIERGLWGISLTAVTAVFVLSGSPDVLTLASWLTLMRSPSYALAYAANDLVLIALWVTASANDPGCAPMIVCFAMFFINDSYGFVNWRRMMRRQRG